MIKANNSEVYRQLTQRYPNWCEVCRNEREVEIVKLCVAGVSLREIGRRMNISGQRVSQVLNGTRSRGKKKSEGYSSIKARIIRNLRDIIK